MKFDYSTDVKSKNSKGGYTKRPLLEVLLSHEDKGKELRFWGLVDSGADLTIVSTEVAETLGVNWREGESISLMGVHGKRQDSYRGILRLRISQFNEVITIPVLYSVSNVPILLGQEGFFDSYRIKFEKDHDTFEITPIPKKK